MGWEGTSEMQVDIEGLDNDARRMIMQRKHHRLKIIYHSYPFLALNAGTTLVPDTAF